MKESNFVYGPKIWIRRPDKATSAPRDVPLPAGMCMRICDAIVGSRLYDAILSPSAAVGRADGMKGVKERCNS